LCKQSHLAAEAGGSQGGLDAGVPGTDNHNVIGFWIGEHVLRGTFSTAGAWWVA